MNEAIYGIIPPTTTPFDRDGEIDYAAARAQVRWMIEQGAHGLAAGGSTGEGHTLDVEEFRRLIAAVSEEAAGRIPVIAGIITDSTRDAVRRGKAVADLPVAALQVTPVHYLFRPTDDAMVEHFRTLCEETGKPVIIYNVVPWTYLSPALLCRIMKEVPDVIGVKQSAGDLKLVADLMLMKQPQDLILSAVDALMYSSFALGCQGAIAAILAAVPRPCVELWDAVKAGEHGKALAIHERLLPLWNAMFADNLPACTKFAQSLQGCPAGLPRQPMPAATAAQQAAIRAALQGLSVEIANAA